MPGSFDLCAGRGKDGAKFLPNRHRFAAGVRHPGCVRSHRGAIAKGWLAVIGILATFVTSLCSSLWASTLASRDSAFCPYRAGARVAETLGVSPADRRAIPITHVIVLVQENRSFDHYFGKLAD